MRAILRTRFGGPEVLIIREIPEPEPKEGHALIQVEAFGLNQGELHMRKGDWAEIADVSVIECVGIVKSRPGGEFPVGCLGLNCTSSRVQPQRLVGSVTSTRSFLLGMPADFWRQSVGRS